MKALIIAENQDAAAEMGAAARGFADEVVALGIGTDLAGVADKSLKVSVPDDRIVEDAWATVCAIADAEQPARVLVEPTTRLSGVAGRLAAHMGAAVITDVLALGPDGATSLYFGGAGERTVAPVGDVALCTVSRGVFDGAGTSGTDAVEEVAFVDPANPVVRVAAEPLEKSDVNLAAADVECGGGIVLSRFGCHIVCQRGGQRYDLERGARRIQRLGCAVIQCRRIAAGRKDVVNVVGIIGGRRSECQNRSRFRVDGDAGALVALQRVLSSFLDG